MSDADGSDLPIEEDASETPPEQAIGAWFKRPELCGCHFAPAYTRKAAGLAMAFTKLDSLDDGGDTLPEVLAGGLRGAAEIGKIGVLLFPEMRRIDELAKLITILARGTDSGWSVAVREPGTGFSTRADEVPIRITLRTRHDAASNVMGIAPIGTMPITRRAPYFALVAWAGLGRNPFREETPGAVGIANCPLEPRFANDEAAYRRRWDESTATMDRISATDVRRRYWLHKTSFVLPAEAIDRRIPQLPAFTP